MSLRTWNLSRNMRNKFLPVIATSLMIVMTGCGSGASVPVDGKAPQTQPAKSTDIPVTVVSTLQEEPKEEVAADTTEEEVTYPPGYSEDVLFDPSWEYADYTVISSGDAKLFRASKDRKDVVIGVNAGHGTKGGDEVKTYCHPDKTPKITGGTTAAGSIKAVAVSGGMSFYDGTKEATVTLRMAELFKDELLDEGFDVLMVRDEEDEQFDNIARTILCNNIADCMISIHWDGDDLSYDKGCFYVSVPDGLKDMEPVASHWQEHDRLGQALVDALSEDGYKIYGSGCVDVDLTQMSYSTVPSVDIELGNAVSAHDDETLSKMAISMVDGIGMIYTEWEEQ